MGDYEMTPYMTYAGETTLLDGEINNKGASYRNTLPNW
jgi:hypothetical protein